MMTITVFISVGALDPSNQFRPKLLLEMPMELRTSLLSSLKARMRQKVVPQLGQKSAPPICLFILL